MTKQLKRSPASSGECVPLVRLAGLEPAAYGLGNRCSIQLSYRRIFLYIINDTSLEIKERSAWMLSTVLD